MHANDAAQKMQYFTGNGTCQIYVGVIQKTNPDDMTVDAYIYSTGTILYSVPIAGVAAGTEQRVLTMPVENTPVLVAYTAEKKPFVLCSYTMDSFETQAGLERVLAGETLASEPNGASNKLTLEGNNIKFSGAPSIDVLIGNGRKYCNSMSAVETCFGFESYKGLDIDSIKIQSKYNSLVDLETSAVYNFYKGIDKKCNTYVADQVTDGATSEVLSDAEKLIKNIESFEDNMSSVESILRTSSDEDAYEVLRANMEKLNKFINPNSKKRVELSFGSNYDGSIFRLRIIGDDGTEKGKIVIDDDANMVIDMASCKIIDNNSEKEQ